MLLVVFHCSYLIHEHYHTRRSNVENNVGTSEAPAARIGVVNSKYLKERRKYVVVIMFIAAAILTPPDPITQIGLALPLLLLYELSIVTVRLIEKKDNA